MSSGASNWRRGALPFLALLVTLPLLATDHHKPNSKKPAAQTSKARARLAKDLRENKGETGREDHPQEATDFYILRRSPNGSTVDLQQLADTAEESSETMGTYSTAEGKFVIPPQTPTQPTASTTGTGTLPQKFTLGVNDPNAGTFPSTNAFQGAWQPLGPGNIGGRTRALLIHHTQNNLMWTAGVAGGIWKSVDSGATWQPKADKLTNIAVNSLIEDAMQENILYAGTGEGYFNADGVRGLGIFKSTDYGENWTQLTSTANPDFYYVQKLAATRAKKGQRIYAATGTGLFRSSDGGATWSKVIDATNKNGCMDVVIQTVDEKTVPYVFAACGTFTQSHIYRALDVDNGQVWEDVFTDPKAGRTSLALAPSNQAVVYALVARVSATNANEDESVLGVYRSAQNGASGTWEQRANYADSNPINHALLSNTVYSVIDKCGIPGFTAPQWINQGWYDNSIAVDPKNENVVWVGGTDLFRSDDGGKNFGEASYWWFYDSTGFDPHYSHADNHVIVFHPKYNGSSNRMMFVGSDGGVFATNDARAAVGTTVDEVCGNAYTPNGVSWHNLNNGYQVTQFYHGAIYPDGSTFFGGTQDNGTPRGNLIAGANGWKSILDGDGGFVAINPNNTSTLFAENFGKSLQRSFDGGANWQRITPGVTEGSGNFLFITPFTNDPSNGDRLYYGGAFVWRSNNDGTNWTRISTGFSWRISAWAVAPSNPDFVYAGTQYGTQPGFQALSGRVWHVQNATQLTGPVTWSFSQPRWGYVSSLKVDPANPMTVFATYSTYSFTNNIGLNSTGHVFKSTDGGVTWANIDGAGTNALPNVPVLTLAIDPVHSGRLYVGTDIGVFVSLDGGANWYRENTGFANVEVEHLQVQNVGGTYYLYAFTHGRSAWRVALSQ